MGLAGSELFKRSGSVFMLKNSFALNIGAGSLDKTRVVDPDPGQAGYPDIG